MVEELTAQNFEEKTGEGLCIVDFWAPWCGPCKMMAPAYEELSKDADLSKLTFFKLNTEDHADPASKLSIMSIPTLVMFNMGEEVGRITGFYPKDKLKEQILGLFGKV